MIRMYVKKPIPIAAVQWNGENIDEVSAFIGENITQYNNTLTIKTLEGDMWAAVGDYILRGVNGEFYPCKEEIFKKTYDEVTC